MAFVGSAHGPGPVPVRRRLSRVHRPRRTGTAGTGRQGGSAGSGAARSRRRGHGPVRLDGQAARATVAGKAMKEGKDDQRPQGQGMRRSQRRAASAPACRRHAWLGGSRARSASSARCTGRSGAACSAGFPGCQVQRGGVGQRPTSGVRTRAKRACRRRKQRGPKPSMPT